MIYEAMIGDIYNIILTQGYKPDHSQLVGKTEIF